ncbi:MAG: type II toxin-antitoxin system VapC family toxin [Planctomycetaceae bacterium]
MLVYLDSNIVVYLVEQPSNFGPRAALRVQALLASGDRIMVSDLTRVECRSNPLAAGDQGTLLHYDVFFSQTADRVMPLSTAVCDRATLIRGQYRYRTPDALHLAAAVEAGCGAFLTNDLRLSSFPDLTVEILP